MTSIYSHYKLEFSGDCKSKHNIEYNDTEIIISDINNKQSIPLEFDTMLNDDKIKLTILFDFDFTTNNKKIINVTLIKLETYYYEIKDDIKYTTIANHSVNYITPRKGYMITCESGNLSVNVLNGSSNTNITCYNYNTISLSLLHTITTTIIELSLNVDVNMTVINNCIDVDNIIVKPQKIEAC